MTKESKFVSQLLQIVAPLGNVQVKSMFGGYGVFLEGSMFALVTRDDELFLKADGANRSGFEERGLKPYRKMPYFAAPPECLTDWAGMEQWARGAVAAAARAKSGKGTKKNKKTR